jgi:accessory gene regulator protein AgrB
MHTVETLVRLRDAAAHVAGEVITFATGLLLLLALAAVAVVLLVCAVAGFITAALREEAVYLWCRLRATGSGRP